jgi:hypothetical protein
MEKKKEEEKERENKFNYSSKKGLKVLTEKDILESLDKKGEKETEDKQIKKGYEYYL